MDVETENVMKALNVLIVKANELYDVVNDNTSAPLTAGRASWERKGIIFSIRTLCENTNIDFHTVLDN